MKKHTPSVATPNEPARRAWIKGLIGLGLVGPFMVRVAEGETKGDTMIIDDFSSKDLTSTLGTQWRGISDQVMGGVSDVSLSRDVIDDRPCLRLRGDVRLENNGGFIQASLDLDASQGSLDASEYGGVRLTVRGNGEQYSVHLRTPDTNQPWQSYRAQFTAGRTWEMVDLPFESFMPHHLERPLDVTRLRRIGMVAIGRAFRADLAVSNLALFR